MASVRNLKKTINYIAGELFMECLFRSDLDEKETDNILTKILQKQDEFLSKANNPNGTKNKKLVKEYYKKLKSDLQKDTDDIIEEILNLKKK